MIRCAKCDSRVGVIGACSGCKRLAKQAAQTHPTSLAQLKRYLRPGMMLTRTHSTFQPDPHPVTITRTQGNAFAGKMIQARDSKEIVSWHHYAKAAAYTFSPAGFSVEIWSGDKHIGTASYTYPVEG